MALAGVLSTSSPLYNSAIVSYVCLLCEWEGGEVGRGGVACLK